MYPLTVLVLHQYNLARVLARGFPAGIRQTGQAFRERFTLHHAQNFVGIYRIGRITGSLKGTRVFFRIGGGFQYIGITCATLKKIYGIRHRVRHRVIHAKRAFLRYEAIAFVFERADDSALATPVAAGFYAKQIKTAATVRAMR